MSETPEALAERALKALQNDDPRAARTLLMQALEAGPNRPDLIHALGVVQLQLGEPEMGKALITQAIAIVQEERILPARREQAEMMLEGFRLGLAAACEDLDEPEEARRLYIEVLEDNPGQPRARQGHAHLLLAVGELDAGRAELATYAGEDRDDDNFIEGATALSGEIAAFLKDDVHPREFLNAHRGAYVEFFDEHAEEQGRLGWIAEAAKMKRNPDGTIVPAVPEGAQPYAGVRVDLVNPRTSEVGQIGDQPMVVALERFPTLARAPILFAWRDLPFDLRVSSQCPWDQLPIQVLLAHANGALALDGVVGDWYTAGFDGRWGSREGGRFHYVSDPEPRRGGRGVVYHVDLGRAGVECIDDLIRRLIVLHASAPIQRVVLGRGFLPAV